MRCTDTDRTHGRRHSDLYSQKENEENGGEAICEEIMGGKFSKVKKGLGPQIQKLKKHTYVPSKNEINKSNI